MFINFQWTETTIIWLVMIGLTYSSSIKNEINCYVCTPSLIFDNTEASEIYSTFSNFDIEKIPLCNSNAATNFTLKCPKGFRGCLTKTYGKNILKSCHEHSITDCKIANNVKYCFCADNLCNNATILSPIPTDDEDLDQSTDDGSGLFDDWTQLDVHKYTKKNINMTKMFNNTFIQNNVTSKTSAAKLNLPKDINILSLLLVVYKVVNFKIL